MTRTKEKLLTADDLRRLYSEGVQGELIRGALCKTIPAGLTHGGIVMNLGGELRNFIRPRRLGRLVGEVHRPNQPLLNLTENNILDGGEALPGFNHPVRDLFDL